MDSTKTSIRHITRFSNKLAGFIFCTTDEESYANAFQWCKRYNKRWSDYKESRKEFMQTIRKQLEKSETEYKDPVIHIGNESWVHPAIAVDLAQWLDEEFGNLLLKVWTNPLAYCEANSVHFRKKYKGFIYLIQNTVTKNVKIGYSTNPKQRIQSLQCATDCKLEIIGIINGTIEIEQKLHREFQQDLIRNEWFRPAPEILNRFRKQNIDSFLAQ